MDIFSNLAFCKVERFFFLVHTGKILVVVFVFSSDAEEVESPADENMGGDALFKGLIIDYCFEEIYIID